MTEPTDSPERSGTAQPTEPTGPAQPTGPTGSADSPNPAEPSGAAPAELTRLSELAERGMRVRREVLGDEHVDRAIENTTDFTRPFQEYITHAAWGAVWGRDGLDRKTRSCITLAVLTALGCHEEIAMHVRAAVRHGLTADEIAEVLLHTAVYAGAPRSNAAFAIAQRTLAELAE